MTTEIAIAIAIAIGCTVGVIITEWVLFGKALDEVIKEALDDDK